MKSNTAILASVCVGYQFRSTSRTRAWRRTTRTSRFVRVAHRVAAIEVMLNSPHIVDLIGKGQIAALKDAIEATRRMAHGPSIKRSTVCTAGATSRSTRRSGQADSANNLRMRIKMEKAGQGGAEKPQFNLQQRRTDTDG